MRRPHRVVEVTQRHLPHWKTAEGTYFVTFRLADSLPKDVADRIAKRPRYHKLADRLLDRGYGSCVLRNRQAASIVASAIEHFDGERYDLHGYVVMPNHAHVAFRARPGFDQLRIAGSWKGYSARRINDLIGRSGALWQDEPYDSLVHDQKELDAVLQYIVRNPVRAGLSEWPWVRVMNPVFRFSAED